MSLTSTLEWVGHRTMRRTCGKEWIAKLEAFEYLHRDLNMEDLIQELVGLEYPEAEQAAPLAEALRTYVALMTDRHRAKRQLPPKLRDVENLLLRMPDNLPLMRGSSISSSGGQSTAHRRRGARRQTGVDENLDVSACIPYIRNNDRKD
jgi:hypothetical protein